MRAAKARGANSHQKDWPPEQREELLRTLKTRFEKNMNRHKGLEWDKVQAKLERRVSTSLRQVLTEFIESFHLTSQVC